MKSTDSEYVPKLKELWTILSEHIKEEESKDLPALEAALAPEESESMATGFSRTKKFVPTRSHPSAGEKPPFETVMGLLTAPFDIISDMFRKFPEPAALDKEGTVGKQFTGAFISRSQPGMCFF
jgi:hypothetical protein